MLKILSKIINILGVIFWPYRNHLVNKLWTKTVSYNIYQWMIIGKKELGAIFNDTYSSEHISFENIKRYDHFCWILDSLNKTYKLKLFLLDNKWIMSSQLHIRFFRDWAIRKSINTHELFTAFSQNPNISRDAYKILYDVLVWSSENLYKRFPRDLIEVDWGSPTAEFSRVINWKLASRFFDFLDERNLKDFKGDLDVEELKKNPNVNMKLVREIFGLNESIEEHIDKLPTDAVSITEDIWKVGEDLYIKSGNRYIKDSLV